MEDKFTLFNYMCDILENFYDKNGLEHLCALDSQYVGNYNDIYQLAWLIRFCEVWEKVEQREVNKWASKDTTSTSQRLTAKN